MHSMGCPHLYQCHRIRNPLACFIPSRAIGGNVGPFPTEVVALSYLSIYFMRSSRHHPSIFQEFHAMLLSRLGALRIRCQARRFLAQPVYGTTRWIVPGCSLPGVHARSSDTRRQPWKIDETERGICGQSSRQGSLCTCLPKFGPLDGACGALGRGRLCRAGCRLDSARCQACRFLQSC